MIRLMLGSMGSGKTACMVREIIKNVDNKINYSNIIIYDKKAKHVLINRDMIVKKELVSINKNGKELFKLRFNKEFWVDLKNKYLSLNIIIDEAHNLLDSRNAMSKTNRIMSNFVSMIRRILGGVDSDYGELILITQLGKRIDPNARNLATSVHYHICHYIKTCLKCGASIKENNEILEPLKVCPRCQNNKFKKSNFIIEKFKFKNVEDCNYFLDTGSKVYYNHYLITDIEDYFKYYNTLQWDDMISED